MSDGINAVICSEDLVYLVLLLHDDGPDFRLHVCRQGVNIGYSSLRYIRMRPAFCTNLACLPQHDFAIHSNHDAFLCCPLAFLWGVQAIPAPAPQQKKATHGCTADLGPALGQAGSN